MGFITHMLLEREAQNDLIVRYLVISLDFNPEGKWKPIGRLIIRKRENCFDVEPLNEWAAQGITVSIKDPFTAEELRGSGERWMAWRWRIRAWAVHLIERRHFPEVYPHNPSRPGDSK